MLIRMDVLNIEKQDVGLIFEVTMDTILNYNNSYLCIYYFICPNHVICNIITQHRKHNSLSNRIYVLSFSLKKVKHVVVFRNGGRKPDQRLQRRKIHKAKEAIKIKFSNLNLIRQLCGKN